MELGLQGRIALVAASSEGIGKAIALGLACEGAHVAMCARRKGLLEAATAEVAKVGGGKVLALPIDVSKGAELLNLVATVVAHFGGLDILVNNAGGPPTGDFTKHSDASWQAAFETNLLSAVRLVRAALPHLQASGRGRIINIVSTAAKQPVDDLILSNAMRAGVVGMAKSLATEFGRYNITVNNIAPGRIATARTQSLDRSKAEVLGITEEQVREGVTSQIPLGRYGHPEELASLAVFLASDRASYITGTTIQVDGGMLKGLI